MKGKLELTTEDLRNIVRRHYMFNKATFKEIKLKKEHWDKSAKEEEYKFIFEVE